MYADDHPDSEVNFALSQRELKAGSGAFEDRQTRLTLLLPASPARGLSARQL